MLDLNTPPRPLRFPQDWLRFLYWVFFKPLTLQKKYLYTIGFSKREPIKLAFFDMLLLALLVFFLTFVLRILGFYVNWFAVFITISFSLLFCILLFVLGGVLGNTLISTTFGGLLGVSFGVLLSVDENVPFGVLLKANRDISFGVEVAFIVALITGVAVGISYAMSYGATFGLSFGVSYIVMYGVISGYSFAVIIAMAFFLGYFRLINYVLYIPIAFLQGRYGKTLRLSPVIWDELIWFPLPGLDNLLFNIALSDRHEGMKSIAYVAGSFRQGWAARQALLALTAHDVAQADTLPKIAAIAENLGWLPEDAPRALREILLAVDEISRHARAALESETLYNRQEQLRRGLARLEQARQGMAYAGERNLARQMIPALEVWQQVFTAELERASDQEKIPNVYVAGSPLIKNSKTFKGRKDLFKMLTNELVSPAGQRPTLLLFGARRMGKTSTLMQLPVQLGPQIVPVTVDLQQAALVENVAGLLALLAREIIRSARLERHLSLPEIDREALAKDPYLHFQDWLEQVETALGDKFWVLLTLDEFEALGEMYADGRTDERIFQLLRGVIQHHPRLTLLLSGAHTLLELPPYWSNYFINVRMLKVGPLPEADAVELITRPIPDFPLRYDEDALRLLLDETGGHPNWIQAACREIVDKMNDANRFQVRVADVAAALQTVPETLGGDFVDFWEGRDASDAMRDLLKEVAAAGGLPAAKLDARRGDPEFRRALDFLLRRDVLVQEEGVYRFRAGLLRRWVQER